MSPALIGVQRRLMELGRIRLGEKGSRGEPKRLTTFRLTSASKELLDAAAKLYGGTVQPWTGAPDEGYYQLTTEASSLPVILPATFSDRDGTPTGAYSQWFEAWSKAGVQRRCDGVTEGISGQPCLCSEPGMDVCKVTTRVSVVLPEVPGIGVWRLESHGWNAATILPGTLDILRQISGGQPLEATLRLEQRTTVREGQTRRFVVPVLETPNLTISDLVNGEGRVQAINPPAPAPPKPALPPPTRLPDDPSFNRDEPIGGTRPALPGQEEEAEEEDPEKDAPPENVITQQTRRWLFAYARRVYGKDQGETELRNLVKQVRGDESTGGMTVAEKNKVVQMIEEVESIGF